MIEHRDVFGDADRVVRRQRDAELPDADPLGLHGDEEIEQYRILGDLEAFDVEVPSGSDRG